MKSDDFTTNRPESRSPGRHVGRRVVVTGMAGAGKSTFSKELSGKTGLPVIHLDLHFWQPGWVEPSEALWLAINRDLVGGDEWILDGNYPATLELRLECADAAVFLDTSWWVCAWRALSRGILKRPGDSELPTGCSESALRRLRDEWRLAWRIGRVHRTERDLELGILSRRASHVDLYVLASKRAIRDFLTSLSAS